MVMRGNVLALMGTFLQPADLYPHRLFRAGKGHWLLGTRFDHPFEGPRDHFATSAASSVTQADLFQCHTCSQIKVDWHGLLNFNTEVFYPYLVGGIPGIIAATISYYVCAVIRAYQTAVARRCAKLSQLKNPADAE
jgi:hypothetical protein